MAETGIQWGSTNGHMQVGINVRYTDITSSTAVANLYVDYYVRSISYGYADNQELRITGEHNDTVGYRMDSASGQTKAIKVVTKTVTGVSTSYSGGPSFTFSANVDGAFDGSNPSKTVNFSLPARPGAKPSAPTATVSNIQTDRATVSCTVPNNNGAAITDYDIQVSLRSDFTTTVVSNASRGQVVTGLKPGTKYFLRARAQNAVGESTWSSVENFTTTATAPDTPPRPDVTNITNDGARATWSAPDANGSAITAYNYKVTRDSGGTNIVTQGTQSGRTVTITGLDPASQHYLFVRAGNAVGMSSWSQSRPFATGASTASKPLAVSRGGGSTTALDLRWNAPADTGGSSVRQYEIQIATNSGFSRNFQRVYSQTRNQIFEGLLSSRDYYVRVRAVTEVGIGAWSDVAVIATDKATPAIVAPSNGALMSPQGGFRFVYQVPGLDEYNTIIYEIKRTSAPVGTYPAREMDISKAASNNRYTYSETGIQPSGAYEVRARVRNNDQGTFSNWSPWTKFVQAHQGLTQTIEPAPGAIYPYISNVVPFKFNFSDAAGALDRITSFQIQVEIDATQTPIVDSGIVNVPDSAYGNIEVSHNLSVGWGYEGQLLRWRVRAWDLIDQTAGWSAWTPFTLDVPPEVTIISPADESDLSTGNPSVDWSMTSEAGATQSRVDIEIMDFDTSETVASWFTTSPTRSSYQWPTVVLRNGGRYQIKVSITDSNGLVGFDTANVNAVYEMPDTIGYNINVTPVNEMGYVEVEWYNAIPDTAFAVWKIFRRELGVVDWTLIGVVTDINQRTYRDYVVKGGTSYLYSVVQVAYRSDEMVDGAVGYRIDEMDGTEVAEVRSYVPEVNTYWLINADDNSNSIRLPGVNTDNIKLEFEKESTHIIGRGRHVDFGDELGYAGSITAKLREPVSVSPTRAAIEDLARAQRMCYLRTPFGRLLPVSLGDIDWSPLAGAGPYDMGDISFPYEEVR